MLKTFRKVIVIALCISLLFSMSLQGQAKENNGDIHKTLKQWEESINSKDFESYVSVFDDIMAADILTLAKTASEEDKKYLQFYAIKKAMVKNIKSISSTEMEEVYPITVDKSNPYEIYYFYFDAEVNDNMKTKYTVDGENFILCVLTKQGNDWKISQFSDAPVSSLLQKNINLGSQKEAKILSENKSNTE